MPKTQKKTGKGRLDKYYHLAKEQGYRARSAFKLVQINKKFNILDKTKVLIDLCAAPGGWLQVAAKYMPSSSLIIGVDLDPIKPIPNVITHQEDITTDKCRATLRQDLKTWKADVVLHDGAPNVGSAWVHDAYSQSELVLSSLKLAVEFLNKGGTFVTKVFRSKDYNNLMWVFNQLFGKVEATKPPSSRTVSAEIFVVCRDFLAPKRIDPKFLDPKHVFQDLDPNSSSLKPVDIFHPEKKRRHRDGYDEGDYTLHKTKSVLEFVKHADPITYLGTVNKLEFDDSDESKIVAELRETTDEVRECFKDLKVLGKKDFKNLLKWRTAARDALAPKKTDEDEEVKVDEEEKEIDPEEEAATLGEELSRLSKEEQSREKRARRRANERRTRELTRMQLNMAIPTEIGLDQDASSMAIDIADEALFDISRVEKAGGRGIVRTGRMADVEDADMDEEKGIVEDALERKRARLDTGDESDDEELDSDAERDRLDAELDEMYSQYKERLGEKDAKYRARQARGEAEEWHGISGGAKPVKFGDKGEKAVDSDEEAAMPISDSRLDRFDDDTSSDDSQASSEEDEAPVTKKQISQKKKIKPTGATKKQVGYKSDDDPAEPTKLSKNASIFFDQPLFKGIDDDSDDEMEDVCVPVKAGNKRKAREVEEDAADDMEIVPQQVDDDDVWQGDSDEERETARKPDYTLMAAEAMTIAQQLVSRTKTKADLIDEGFNRYAFNDTDGLPDWFLDEERQHCKRQMPISKEAAQAIQQRLRALDARPIKKIAEAKARKKYKAVQKFNKVMKKADTMMENTEMSEKSKAISISKILEKGKRKPKKEVKLVVSKGTNKGKQGRPKGVKGRYKMVDSRMKKEVRAEKRKNSKGGKRQKRG